MCHEFINEILEQSGETPVLLDDCVLNITDNRHIIYLLYGDSDYDTKELEICYADNHSDIIYKGIVKSKDELKNIILKTIK